ncbi:MAG: MBL fold metallo-hydrolase [Polaromonas sp.]|uniref:MBL fold metallo-hydrolase n=1 Tax=Polaromonas sp. TaxID=1869339 RepID=UPI00273017EB|nr:MBL fold metallo-hydrolase [Polaromonas sp.]MDP2449355.1 MBL fold metallo-hydrolase [Polaromonas sp.]MDP3829390.1 MBL fold metallo-hydrolase [Polaromonas sp.]
MTGNSFCWRGLGALLAALSALTVYADPVPAMVAQKVSPSAWYVEGVSALGSPANQNFISNAGFVVTPAGVVVIDALGSPALATRLIAEIRKVTPQPVTHVIVTHYHADHIYGLQAFKAQGARIVAHRAARAYMTSETARLRLETSRQELAPWIDAQTRLVEADEWIDKDKELVVGGVRFQLKHVGPSHTLEDLAIYLPSEKVLFAGDLVFRSRIPYVGQADSRHWIVALDDLLAFDTAVIVPGHGPLSSEARKDMQLTRDYLVYLRTAMGQAARNLEPFEEAYQATDWSRFEHLPLFRVANRMNAYNTYLLLEQETK